MKSVLSITACLPWMFTWMIPTSRYQWGSDSTCQEASRSFKCGGREAMKKRRNPSRPSYWTQSTEGKPLPSPILWHRVRPFYQYGFVLFLSKTRHPLLMTELWRLFDVEWKMICDQTCEASKLLNLTRVRSAENSVDLIRVYRMLFDVKWKMICDQSCRRLLLPLNLSCFVFFLLLSAGKSS